ncbi:MAG: rRNA maturation RNase YbeY [Comamonadaceae bacterium]|nr:rRNA maturation RNase YbeY [Comamonadaceae bacterium]
MDEEGQADRRPELPASARRPRTASTTWATSSSPCPVAARQAREKGHALDRELRLLAIHGYLHLLGYDHFAGIEEEERKAARALPRMSMSAVGWIGLGLALLAAFLLSLFHIVLGGYSKISLSRFLGGPGQGRADAGSWPASRRRSWPSSSCGSSSSWPWSSTASWPSSSAGLKPFAVFLAALAVYAVVLDLVPRPARLRRQAGHPEDVPARPSGPCRIIASPLLVLSRHLLARRGAAGGERRGPRGLRRGDRDLHRRGHRGGHHRRGRGRAPAQRRRVRRHPGPGGHDAPGQHGLHPPRCHHRQPQGPDHQGEVLADPRLQGPARQHGRDRHGQGHPRVLRRQAQGPAHRGPHPPGRLRPRVHAGPGPPARVPEGQAEAGHRRRRARRGLGPGDHGGRRRGDRRRDPGRVRHRGSPDLRERAPRLHGLGRDRGRGARGAVRRRAGRGRLHHRRRPHHPRPGAPAAQGRDP